MINKELETSVNEMIEHYDKQPASLASMAIRSYLRGVRDALGGADERHILKNVKLLSS